MSTGERVVICTTFWGYEKPVHTPPNVVVCGPLLDTDTKYLQRLKEKDASLLAWLDDAEAKGEPVCYFTLGSECIWQQWYIDNVLDGLEKLKQKGLYMRMIWAIKTGDVTFPEARKQDGMNWVS